MKAIFIFLLHFFLIFTKYFLCTPLNIKKNSIIKKYNGNKRKEIDNPNMIKDNYLKRNLNVGTYTPIYQSYTDHPNIYTSHAIQIDSESFAVCGDVLHLWKRNGDSFTKTIIDSSLNGRSCFQVNSNEIVLSMMGGILPLVPTWNNNVYVKNGAGIFQERNDLEFNSYDTGAAHNYLILDQNSEYVAFNCLKNVLVPSSVQIYKRINGKYNSYDSVFPTGNVKDLAYFRDEYIVIVKDELAPSIIVYKMTADFKISTNPVYQVINTSVNPSSILNFDDNLVIVGYSDGTIKVFEFVNNSFAEKIELDIFEVTSVVSLVKINDHKFSATYSQGTLGLVNSTKTIIYFKQRDTFIFFQEISGPGGSQYGVRLNVFDDNTIIINYSAGYIIYRMSCTSPSLKNNNCLYCLEGQYREDGICKSKCYNLGNIPNVFRDCVNCGTSYSDGPPYNKLNILTSECVANCPANLQAISIGNDSYICDCKDGSILLNNECIPQSSGCGKGGFLGNNNICLHCPTTYQEEVENKIILHNNNCISECPHLFVKNIDSSNNSYCMACAENQLFYDLDKCVSNCPKKFVKYSINDKTHWECIESCSISSISNSSGECLVCPSDKLFVGLNSNNQEECYKTCPSNYVQDISTMRCIKCNQNEISFNNVCMECSKRTDGKIIFYNNDCISSCPDNHIYDSINKNCKIAETSNSDNLICPKYTTKSLKPELLYRCTEICDNDDNFYVSYNNDKLCVKCHEENSFVNFEEKKCVIKCPTNYGTNSSFSSKVEENDSICKPCDQLKFNKLNHNGICITNCPEGYEINDNYCKLITDCEGYCSNNGICSNINSKLECDCSLTDFTGIKCEIPKEKIVNYMDKFIEYLEKGMYKEVLNLLTVMPVLKEFEIKYLIYDKLDKLLDDTLNLKVPYNSDILILADAFYLAANE